MRLLHSTTLEFRDFPNHEGVPYAILSHTWAEDEVLFPDMDGFNATTMPQQVKEKIGFKKIEACCAQARRDEFDYVWIDTCCIDKRSSAELSEAINSMYRWYRDCTVCYAYLADVPNNASQEVQERKFRESRWFTRGWTLQELIGPLTLEFYGDQWHALGQSASLGTKLSLQSEILHITKIPMDVFLSRILTSGQANYRIAQRMSWAAGRSTARIEDGAYCLLGLFNINMPLLYGEGHRAFIRFQEEIMKVSTDESLFAWSTEEYIRQRSRGRGLLATSADSFAKSGQIMGNMCNPRKPPSVVTNRGLRLELTLLKGSHIFSTPGAMPLIQGYKAENYYIAVLNCQESASGKMIGILLAHSGGNREDGEFVRVDPTKIELIHPNNAFCVENGTTIYARLTNLYGLQVAAAARAMSHLDLTGKLQGIVIKECPRGFRVRGEMSSLWTQSDGDVWIMKFSKYLNALNLSSELGFDDGIDSFTVHCAFFAGSPKILVLPGVGSDLTEGSSPGTFIREGYSDRATCLLSSQRLVSASLRPERWRGDPCYVLRISVNIAS
ncbi:Heterokaryon incompatibility protein (HET) domain containing protein [Hyaloscypha variabilis]